MSMRRRSFTVIVVALLVLVSDQFTKRQAANILAPSDSESYFGGLVRLQYAENTGAWGNLGDNWPEPWRTLAFIVIPLAVLAWLVAHMLRKPYASPWEVVGYSLILGGGLGNIIDRLAYGFVVDFMYVGWGPVGTNIFNVADVAVMCGMGILVFMSFGARPLPTAARS